MLILIVQRMQQKSAAFTGILFLWLLNHFWILQLECMMKRLDSNM